MAETMKLLGYVASAFGNHELDFGQDAVRENAKIQGYDFLAANITWTPSSPGLPVKPMLMIRRAGIQIAIIGTATRTTPAHLLPESSKDLVFLDEEQTLAQAIPEAWKAGADVVITTSHVCPNDVTRYVNTHPDWHLAFAGAGHCHFTVSQMAGSTPVLEPGADLKHYARVKILVDLAKPQAQRVVSSSAELVNIGQPPKEPIDDPRVAQLAAHISSWQSKVDSILGEEIGFTEKGFEVESPAMVRWLLGAWREQLNADVAITNRWSMRQALPPGPLKLQYIYDILPFNNHIVRVKLKGTDLISSATCCHGAIEGMKLVGDKWELSTGRLIEPNKIYDVITTDYTYMGGSGFKFRHYDPNGQVLMDFREPVIAWTRAHKSSSSAPLESLLNRLDSTQVPTRKPRRPDAAQLH
jgi:2',3'-cyclic-nucleotide 2'-phosphodiesterase (5'-nucleotidase family)